MTTTREDVDISIPAIARAMLQSAQTLQTWQTQGIVDTVCLTGPFTKLKTLVILNEVDHDAVFNRIGQLPAVPYLDIAIRNNTAQNWMVRKKCPKKVRFFLFLLTRNPPPSIVR
ncbi:MAG: hypothetical protein ACK4G3_04785 [bacterium]